MRRPILKGILDTIKTFQATHWVSSISNSNGQRGDDEFERRREEALELLARYQRDRYPFVLFLRTFRTHFVLGNPAYPGDPDGVYLLRDRINKALQHNVGVLAIAEVGGEFPSLSSAKASAAPLLSLRNEDWESTVDCYIRWASIIVTEVQQLSWGVIREFEMIHQHHKEGHTVVVVPDPGVDYGLSELRPPLADMPRVVCVSELLPDNPLKSFVFADLLERTYKIACLRGDERLAIDLNGEWRKRFPLTFEGVGRGYERQGKVYLNQGALGLATARFKKALIALGVQGDLKGRADQYVNLCRVGCAAGDGANARQYLEQSRDSLAEHGYKFDVETILRELANDGFL